MQEFILKANAISKSYGLFKALSDLTLEVPRGGVFALVGPNGAGKTSFVKIVLDLIGSDSGELSLFDSTTISTDIKSKIAYLPEKFTFYDYYTIDGVLKFYADMRGVPKATSEQVIDEALSKVSILDIKSKKISELSKGQLQRVGIASLLVGESEFFILDEPFSGLDPIGIKDIKDIIIELKDSGKTIFVNSHILAELAPICDYVAVLNKGRCLAQGKKEEIIGERSLEDVFYEMIKADGGQD